MVRDNQGFQIKCFDQEILGDYLDEAEFNAVITQASRIAEKLYSRKRISDNIGIEKYKVFLSFLSGSLLTLFMVFMTLSILKEQRDFEYSSYGVVSAGLSISTFLMLYEAFRNSKNNIFRFKDVLTEHLEELCDIQCELFKSRGVEWRFDGLQFQMECRAMIEVRAAEEKRHRQARLSVGR